MKRTVLLIFLFGTHGVLFAQNEVGPDGGKLLWLLLIFLGLVLLSFLQKKISKKKPKKNKQPFFQLNKVKIQLEKDSLYFPDTLKLTVKNNGTDFVDLDRPLLVFDNFWMKRKFRLKGMGNRAFYPLYLEKGETHTLQIDLNRFYLHDKRLKKFPKVKIIISDVKKKRLGSKTVYLRKTLFKY